MTISELHPTAQMIALEDWDLVSRDGSRAERVRVPHDAMISAGRGQDAPGGADAAWFFGGHYVYQTSWSAPSSPNSVTAALRFEGVQGDSEVFVNHQHVGHIRGGYAEFEFPIDEALRWDEENVIRVEVDNNDQPNSRWYSGTGLYRPVHLILRPTDGFPSDGVQFRTLRVESGIATIEVTYSGAGPGEITAELWDHDRLVAADRTNGDEHRLVMQVAAARLWSAELPFRYRLVSMLRRDGEPVDYREDMVGLRTISVDATRGLRVNDSTVLLRGACIHHDNGVLGAATHRAAEFRRVRLLKEAGFNAIRSAHHPMSRDLLDACDEIGMYVLDEFADYWVVSKTAYDHAGRFQDTWRTDADRMIEKDRNRPSVIMYAIGNEIPETATSEGVALAREISDYFREADPDRPVTVAVNIFLNVLVSLGSSPYKEKGTAERAEKTSMAGSTEANVMVNQIGRMMNLVSRLPRADKATRDVFNTVDVAGYNYGLARYDHDVRAYPDRVILGTETLPGDVARAWELVQKHPAVIGDFVWAGWDFLGEAGVGLWVPGKRAGLSKPYPYILHGGGMIDLTGRPDVSLRLAQAAWGTLDTPAIAVRPLDRSGQPVARSAWRFTDAVESWAWRGCEGRKAEIEVYSTHEEIELVLNGRSLGRRRSGKKRGFVARFSTSYEPGELVAIGFCDGKPVSRTELRSADAHLSLSVAAEVDELRADGADLAFVTVEIADRRGTVEMLADQLVSLEVSGPATLIGFGTAAPATEEPFTSSTRSTYRGRAQAVLRSTGQPGTVRVTAHAEFAGDAVLHIPATA